MNVNLRQNWVTNMMNWFAHETKNENQIPIQICEGKINK